MEKSIVPKDFLEILSSTSKANPGGKIKSKVDKPLPTAESNDDKKVSKNVLTSLDQADVDAKNNTTDLRKKTANYAAWYAGASLFLWALVVLISLNYSMLNNGKEIFNDTKFIAITTGSTVNSVAAFIAVVRGLFGSTEK